MFANVPPRPTLRHLTLAVIVSLLFQAGVGKARAVEGISSNALQQIQALIAEKDSRTAAQLKMDSQILYALRASRNEPMAPGVAALQFLPVPIGSNDLVKVDIDATVSSNLLSFITSANGQIIASVPQFDSVRALVPISIMEQLATRSDVRFISPATEPHTN